MPKQAQQFLVEFKQIAAVQGVDLVPRKSTRPTLLQLGLTKRNVKDILLSLSVSNYCKGPEDDRDRPGEIWVFGILIKGKEIYIKLKIAKCLSFHIADFPLNYPHR